MGQYYCVALKDSNGFKVSHRRVRGEDYIFAKLMEHSWMKNILMDNVAAYMFNDKINLAWVGDYAEQDEIRDIIGVSYDDIWGENVKEFTFPNMIKRVCDVNGKYVFFKYRGRCLINHTKKEYISFDDYINTIKEREGKRQTWIVNPISLLTAIGNGRGGGDYRGLNEDKVGIWAWDVLEIVNKSKVPNDYEKRQDIMFIEEKYI